MSQANQMPSTTARAVGDAVYQNEQMSAKGLLERAFAFAFRGLVYAQIWEDPLINMEAMEIGPDSDIVTIASGGCNMLSYLTAGPRSLDAVDLNTAHVGWGGSSWLRRGIFPTTAISGASLHYPDRRKISPLMPRMFVRTLTM